MSRSDPQSEEILNRRLRRADWRFLLANPSPRVSICFANGPLASAVQAISSCVLDRAQTRAGACDLAVAVDPDRKTLCAAWQALRPGGSLYAEFYSPLAAAPARLRRQLQAAGFETINCYWAWPLPARAPALFWIPVEARGARRYFLSSRPADPDRRHQWRRRWLHGLWRAGLQLGIMFPLCVTASKPVLPVEMSRAASRTSPSLQLGSARSGPFDMRVAKLVHSGWDAWGLGPSSEQLSCLLLTGGSHSSNKVVGLVFVEPDPQPKLAIKLPRVAAAIPSLENEACTLRGVHAGRANGMRGVPRVLFSERQDNFFALGESALTGWPLFTQLTRNNFRELAFKVLEWQIELAESAERVEPVKWWDRLVGPVLADFDRSFGRVIDPIMLHDTETLLRKVGPLPLVCEQRDFSPWNVLLDSRQELIVLDWESAELEGLPGLDLIYFLTYLCFFLEGAMQSGVYRPVYQAAWDGSTSIGRVAIECLKEYGQRLSLDPAVLHPLRLLTWLLHSRSEYKRYRAEYGENLEAEILERSLFLQLWLQELG